MLKILKQIPICAFGLLLVVFALSSPVTANDPIVIKKCNRITCNSNADCTASGGTGCNEGTTCQTCEGELCRCQ